jgi:hypothetical protein
MHLTLSKGDGYRFARDSAAPVVISAGLTLRQALGPRPCLENVRLSKWLVDIKKLEQEYIL